jgi:hypothetical protein
MLLKNIHTHLKNSKFSLCVTSALVGRHSTTWPCTQPYVGFHFMTVLSPQSHKLLVHSIFFFFFWAEQERFIKQTEEEKKIPCTGQVSERLSHTVSILTHSVWILRSIMCQICNFPSHNFPEGDNVTIREFLFVKIVLQCDPVCPQTHNPLVSTSLGLGL